MAVQLALALVFLALAGGIGHAGMGHWQARMWPEACIDAAFSVLMAAAAAFALAQVL